MPWTVRDVDEHKQGLTQEQKRQWVRVANSVLKDCQDEGGTNCDAKAIRAANGTVNKNTMETNSLTLHSTIATQYAIRHETFEGRDHIVVPVVMMVEGVHNGSRGPLFHSAEQLGRFTTAWNGIPITIQHPQSNGVFVSANDPEQLELSVGRVFNTQMDGVKLKAEAWLDSSRLIAISPEAAEYIEQGKPLEISVGVFNDEISEEGEWQGENYVATAVNHRPDHLALLPGGQGACSWSDGCGIRTNEAKGGKMPDDLLKELKDFNKKGYSVNLIANAKGYREVMQSLQSKLDAMDTADRMYFLVEVYEDAFVYEVRSRETEGTTLYKRGYSVTDNEVELNESPVEVRREVEFVTMSKDSKMRRNKFNNNNKNEGGKMACCEDKVDRLIANEASRFTANDKEWLMDQEESTLNKLFPILKEPEEVEVNRDKALEVLSLEKVEDYMEIMPKEMKADLQKGLKLYKERRAELIKNITDNSEFSAEDLETHSDDWLEKLSKSFTEKNGNYSGLGSAYHSNGENEEKYIPPQS